MDEERRSVKVTEYEDLYDVTRSGRIITKKTNHVKVYNGDPYGFANVHLYKDGKRELFKSYEIWKDAFYDGTNDVRNILELIENKHK